MSDTREVLVDVSEGVMTITMNRPEAKNAMNKAMAEGISAAIDEFEANADIRVAVLAGNGGTFCSGMDLKGFLKGESPSVKDRGFGGISHYSPAKPLIAATEGYALAGGFELVLACDMVVAARTTKFGLPEVKTLAGCRCRWCVPPTAANPRAHRDGNGHDRRPLHSGTHV